MLAVPAQSSRTQVHPSVLVAGEQLPRLPDDTFIKRLKERGLGWACGRLRRLASLEEVAHHKSHHVGFGWLSRISSHRLLLRLNHFYSLIARQCLPMCKRSTYTRPNQTAYQVNTKIRLYLSTGTRTKQTCSI